MRKGKAPPQYVRDTLGKRGGAEAINECKPTVRGAYAPRPAARTAGVEVYINDIA